MISPKVRLLTNSPTPHNTPRVATVQRHRQEQPKISSGCCTPPRILGLWGCPPSMCQWATCAHLPAELSALERGVRKVGIESTRRSYWHGPGPMRVWTEEVAVPQTRATALEPKLGSVLCRQTSVHRSTCLQRVSASSRCLTKQVNVNRKLMLSN